MDTPKGCFIWLAIPPLFSIKKQSKAFCFILLFFTSVMSFTSIATEVNGLNTDKYLLNSCNAFKTSADNDKYLPCIMYIKGFFNGLLNAGNADVTKISEKNKKPATLVERAYANRVGRKAQRKPLRHSCMTVDELKLIILNDLSNESAGTFLSVKQLNAFLIKALTNACSPDNKSDGQ